MMDQLKTFFHSIYPLSDQATEDLTATCILKSLPKNYFLLRQGENCSHVWIVMKGLIRHYYVDTKGREINTWFSDENSVSTTASLFEGQSPSFENIQLLEDSVVFELAIDDLKDLLLKHHSLCLWYIKALESIYIAYSEKRIDELYSLDAKARYERLLTDHPTFINRISLGNLASYLRITQETLSRIRSQR